MSDKRQIRFNGEDLGEYTIDALYRDRMRGDIDHTAEFLSVKSNAWLPLAGILDDLDSTVTTAERLQQMKEAGITKVEFLPSGNKGDCPVCRALAKEAYSVDAVPTIPPENCTCTPWCTLVALAHV
jgi:hypothetical protein